MPWSLEGLPLPIRSGLFSIKIISENDRIFLGKCFGRKNNFYYGYEGVKKGICYRKSEVKVEFRER